VSDGEPTTVFSFSNELGIAYEGITLAECNKVLRWFRVTHCEGEQVSTEHLANATLTVENCDGLDAFVFWVQLELFALNEHDWAEESASADGFRSWPPFVQDFYLQVRRRTCGY